MSASYAERRRHWYRIDRGYRAVRRRSSYEAKGRGPPVRIQRDSWSQTEVCGVLGLSRWTLWRFERMGIIPKPTYPSGRKRYWRHQVVLLIWLFESMRMEGWPSRLPHFVGSRYWTLALTRLNTEWGKELPHEG